MLVSERKQLFVLFIDFDLRKERKKVGRRIKDGRFEFICGWNQGVLGGEVVVPGELHEVHQT